jgi:hypothetical protein
VSPVKYKLGFYIPEDILHSHCRENLKFCNEARSMCNSKGTSNINIFLNPVSCFLYIVKDLSASVLYMYVRSSVGIDPDNS